MPQRALAPTAGRPLLWLVGLAATLPAAVAPAAAQPSRPAAEPAAVQVPRLDRPPTLEQFLGSESGGSAQQMTPITAFVQRTPSDGQAATERTEAYIGYDGDNLYLAFRAHDRSPDQVRARMVRREAIDGDDQVSVMIDTYRDRRRAFFFAVNPYGIQRDALWNEGEGFNASFDTLWHSEGRPTPNGYAVLMTLPFKSLRFSPAERQTWNIILSRQIPRVNEVSYWPRVSSRVTGFLSQAARLEGLSGISPGRNMQFIPFGSHRAFRALDARNPDLPRFVSRRGEVDGGIDAKFVLSDNLALDATLNPDFSQVESDDPQVTVNQRFEVFFPEKRPFFLENAHFFDTPIDNLVFTRRIADPQFGVRLTGKTGPYALGAFVIDDQSPGKRVAPGTHLEGSRAFFGVARVSRDILDQSSISFLFTDRELANGYNRVGGIDGRFRWARNWTLEYQAVGSATKDLDGGRRTGHALDFEIEYAGRQFFYVTEYNDRSPEFVTETGFVPRTDFRRTENSFWYRFRPEGPVLIAWGPQVFTDRLWDYDGTRLDWGVRPGVGIELKGRTFVNLNVDVARERLRPGDFATLRRPADFSRNRTRVSGSTEFLPQLGVSAVVFFGDGINFVPPEGVAPAVADELGANLTLTLRPTTALRWDATYLLRRLADRDTGRKIFENSILRSRWNWQFTRELSVRAILQYSSTRVNGALTSLDRERNFNADLLVTYLVNPWTALHVGYNSNLRNIALLPSPTGVEIVRGGDSLINDGRQVFVKVSYLLRR